MLIHEAYNIWSEQYDTNENKTRDLEADAIRNVLANFTFENCLEIGCGTGKNTLFLSQIAHNVLAVDFSEKMLGLAKEKIHSENVRFQQTDITKIWNFTEKNYELITFSLVLEHIENLDFIFSEIDKKTVKGSFVYIGELHPAKQYIGKKACFESENGISVLTCYTHHISDFIQPAQKYNFEIADLKEYFDNNEKTTIPRILSLLFRKK